MRISELAEVVGVTTRAIRHYHHLGLLPEPERLPNGYRDYGLRQAVLLARAVYADLDPAQAAAVHRSLVLLQEEGER